MVKKYKGHLDTAREFADDEEKFHKTAVQTMDKLELDVKLLPMSINLQAIAETAKAKVQLFEVALRAFLVNVKKLEAHLIVAKNMAG